MGFRDHVGTVDDNQDQFWAIGRGVDLITAGLIIHLQGALVLSSALVLLCGQELGAGPSSLQKKPETLLVGM
jgi:hypothetical protein